MSIRVSLLAGFLNGFFSAIPRALTIEMSRAFRLIRIHVGFWESIGKRIARTVLVPLWPDSSFIVLQSAL